MIVKKLTGDFEVGYARFKKMPVDVPEEDYLEIQQEAGEKFLVSIFKGIGRFSKSGWEHGYERWYLDADTSLLLQATGSRDLFEIPAGCYRIFLEDSETLQSKEGNDD